MNAVKLKAAEKISFRPGNLKDAQRMCEIDRACFEPGISYTIEIFYYHLLINRDPSFVAVHDGRIVGFILTSRSAKATSLLVTIDIMEGWRRQGLGTKLLQIAEQAQKKRGCRTIKLQVDVEN
ncbi:MAG: GNAT family N-acetyltransferase, partial [Nitrospinota bacterium]